MEADRYRLQRLIGSGGMAQVFEAVALGEAGFERRVAIKRILPGHFVDPSFRRMFLDEARIVSRLHHGNIIQVHDFGVVDGTELMVMEFIDGIDAWTALKVVRQRGTFTPPRVALFIIAEISRALNYAHTLEAADGQASPIVHRDVSPQNILLSWSGDVKLVDFGIAFCEDRSEKTRTGVVKGKPSYMAPEQIAGEAITAAIDIYALGATLYALLAGAPPRASERMGRPTGPTPDPISGVRELIDEMMSVDPEARPTAREVIVRAEALCLGTISPRSELERWLTEIRPLLDAPSKLDALVDALIVRTSSEGSFSVQLAEPSEPSVTTVRAPAMERAGSPGASDSVESAPVIAPVPSPPARSWRLPLTVIGLVAVAAVGGASATLMMNGRADNLDRHQPETTSPDSFAAGMADDAGSAVDAGGRTVDAGALIASADASLESAIDGAASAGSPSGRPHSRRRRRGPADRPAQADTLPRVSPSERQGTAAVACLRVAGARAYLNPVFVDGRFRHHAVTPDLNVSLGRHVVVIRDRQTQDVLLERSVLVTESHTPGNCLLVRF